MRQWQAVEVNGRYAKKEGDKGIGGLYLEAKGQIGITVGLATVLFIRYL